MSSRTAAWGQPPVSMALMREGGSAECAVRNSASSLGGVSCYFDDDGDNELAREGEGKGGKVPSKNIIRNSRNAIFIAKGKAELKHQGCFPGADWSVCGQLISTSTAT